MVTTQGGWVQGRGDATGDPSGCPWGPVLERRVGTGYLGTPVGPWLPE